MELTVMSMHERLKAVLHAQLNHAFGLRVPDWVRLKPDAMMTGT
jgi:hypothetical protein